MDDIYVVVPAYNEGTVIGATLAGLLPLGHTIVVVDDGSTDETSAEAALHPVHLLRHAINLGQGAALWTGTAYALEQGARAVVHFDADGQHVPASVTELLAPILAGEADIVLGSRFLDPGHAAMIPTRRRWVLGAARIFHRITLGIRLSDAHNGLRAFSRPAARALRLEQDRMAHASEIVRFVSRERFRYLEVPTPVSYSDYSRAKGQSSLGAVNILTDLLFRRLFQ